MPDLLRKIFLPDGDRAAGLETGGGAGAAALSLGPPTAAAPVWLGAPIALARYAGGEIVQWNPACDALLREAVGEPDQAGRRWLTAAVARLLAGERHAEILAGTTDTFSLEVRLGAELPGGEGRLVAVRDVAGTAGASDDLVETVSTLSHELRTPLTSMKSSLGLVMSGETGELTGDQTRFLDMTMRNIDRLERLVSDLLDVSRSQQQAPLLRRRDCDLGPVLREAVQMQEAAARQAGLELDLSGLPANYPAHVDPDKVVQILTNVVGNSLKYTPRGGLVRVWLEARPRLGTPTAPALAWLLAEEFFLPLDTFNLVIEDNGVGLSQADQGRVFEPWFRAEQSGRRRVAGAGLGLHITRSLVEAHGGRIRLASEIGRGTTVWIRLPRDEQSEGLIMAARRLRDLMEGSPLATVAVLDGRPAGSRPELPVDAWAGSFLPGAGSSGGPGSLVTLAPSLIATVVDDPEAWAARWRVHLDGNGLQRRGSAWRFFTGPFGDQ